MKTFRRGLLWKIPFVSLAILILYYEIDAYTSTKGSIGELLLYSNQDKSFLISASITAILGFIMLFVKSKTLTIILICIICFVLLLFFPLFDMEGVNHSF